MRPQCPCFTQDTTPPSSSIHLPKNTHTHTHTHRLTLFDRELFYTVELCQSSFHVQFPSSHQTENENFTHTHTYSPPSYPISFLSCDLPSSSPVVFYPPTLRKQQWVMPSCQESARPAPVTQETTLTPSAPAAVRALEGGARTPPPPPAPPVCPGLDLYLEPVRALRQTDGPEEWPSPGSLSQDGTLSLEGQ